MQNGFNHVNVLINQRLVRFSAGRYCQARRLQNAALTNAPVFDDKIPPPSADATDVLICGGGIAGVSVAFHLAKRGLKNVVLLEQGRIGGGSTWISGGLMSARHLWQHPQAHGIAAYSSALAQRLSESYPEIDYVKCGRLILAQSDAHNVDIRRTHAIARAFGYETRLLEKEEAINYHAALNVDGVKAALYIADDARLNHLAFCRALAQEARNNGVKIVENCRVHSLKVGDDCKVYGAETDQGFLKFKNFVNAAGLWANSIAIEGFIEHPVKIPSQACCHSYLVVTPPEAFVSDIPVLHDLDDNVYVAVVKNNPATGIAGSALICGGFHGASSRPVFVKTPPSRDFNYQQLPDEWDLFYPIMDKLTRRFPSLSGAKVQRLVTSAESYTPDGYALVGQTQQVPNYFVASGFNGSGSSWAGGVGRLLADWIVDSEPPHDVSKVDVARLLEMHANKYYLSQRVPEVVSLSFTALMPTHQCETARNLRTSPVHQHLRAAGAVFGEIMGYERPLFFARDKSVPFVGEDAPLGRPVWFSQVKSEYEACRERVGVMDMSNFSKFELFSKDDEVVRFLQQLCSADIDKPVGSTVFTGMQNEKGGYVTDCTISRFGKSHFFIIAPTVQQVRLKLWLERHVQKYGGVSIQDVTSMYTAFNIIGPSSRHLLQDLTEDSMSSTDFPSFCCKEISVGYASNIKAISVTHCGELGWVLYIPNEFAQHIYERIIEVGRSYGLQHAGYYTLRQLRIEKFYVYWGMDIDLTTTPNECGRLFRVNMDKGEFIGRESMLRERDEGVRRRYVQVLIDREKHDLNVDPWPQGNEPLYRNNKFCGLTTTAAYGFTLASQVCIGYIQNLNDKMEPQMVTSAFVMDKDAEYEIDIADKRYPVKVNLHSPSIPMMSSEHPQHYRPTQ